MDKIDDIGAIKEPNIGDITSNLVDELKEITQSFMSMQSQYQESITLKINKFDLDINEALNELKNSILDIQAQVNAIKEFCISKDKESQRFRDGYDLKIKKMFLLDILKMQDDLYKELDKFDGNEAIKSAIMDIQTLLENSGIIRLDINENDSYIGKESIAKVAKVEFVDDEKLDYIISSVIKQGYKEEQTGALLRPASVIISKLKGQLNG